MDGIIIAILLLFALVGYSRGLVRSACTFVSSILALALSFIIYPIINFMLKMTPAYTEFYKATLDRIEKIDFGQGIQTQGENIIAQINWLPSIISEQIKANNNAATYEMLQVGTLQEYITTYITNMVIALLAIFITWIIIKLVIVGLINIVGGIVEHLPVISTFNHLGGFIFGIMKGILMLSLIALIVPIFIENPLMESIRQSIDSSILAKWLYENNLILLIYNKYIV